MKFASALAVPALFLGALAAPVVEKRQSVDVASITELVNGFLADVEPITAAINATDLTSTTTVSDLTADVAEIADLVSNLVSEISPILSGASAVTSSTTDVVDTVAVDSLVSGTVTDTLSTLLKSRQIVDVGSLVDLNAALELVFEEISATLDAANAVVELPAEVLSPLSTTISSLTDVLTPVTDVVSVVAKVVPSNVLSLLGL